jgi:hypothetical protein
MVDPRRPCFQAFCDEYGFRARGVIQSPGGGDGFVQFEEILEACPIAAADGLLRNVVASCTHAISNTLDRESADGSHRKKKWTAYPDVRRRSSHGAKLRVASVVSNAKSIRCSARSRNCDNITRPAANAAESGSNSDKPRAITSALTNSLTARAPCNNAGAAVDFPAPFGPARMTTLGRGSLIVLDPAYGSG